MDTARFRKALPRYLLIAALTTGVVVILGEFILVAALTNGVAMIIGPVLPATVFAEPLETSPLITPINYFSGGGYCPVGYGGFYPC